MCPGVSWGILGCPGVIRMTHSDMGHCFSSVVKVSKDLFIFF